MGNDFKIAVPRNWLVLIAGLIWSAVGVMLTAWAVIWLSQVGIALEAEMAAAGVAIALASWWFGFRRLARANAERIEGAPDWACIFSFQTLKSYLIMAFMIVLGIVLRNSPIPKYLLSVVYMGVGGGLFLASLTYYRAFIANVRHTDLGGTR